MLLFPYRLGIRKLDDDKYLVLNLLDGQSDFASPFSTWEQAYSMALRKIWFEHTQDLLVGRLELLIESFADEHGLNHKLVFELLQWPYRDHDEEKPATPSTDWLKP